MQFEIDSTEITLKEFNAFQTILQRTIDKTYLNEIEGYVHIHRYTTMYTMKAYFFLNANISDHFRN